ncbi:MAG: tetratricopeptide repeat protein [Muribaculaceae bacterium]|nr:tetratricopeptide repeat protein [Muribaculaceae bacterium]
MNDITQQITEISKLIDAAPNAELYLRRGKLYWQLGERRLAINDYNSSAALDPDGPGATALKATQEIMDFYNHDLYNP